MFSGGRGVSVVYLGRTDEVMIMGFGRNPYVAKAQAAEQKALDSTDDDARARAHREAAHEWDRAAEREVPGKRRTEYEENATRVRALLD